MLVPPNIPEKKIMACLHKAYGVKSRTLTFLPLGADVNAASYRLSAESGQDYFVKLKRGAVDEIGIVLPHFLHAQGITQVIAPLPALDGQLWSKLEDFQLVLYPFVQGRSGLDAILSARQWVDFGRAIQRIHTLCLPAALASALPREAYTPRYRQQVQGFLEQVKRESYQDPVAVKVAGLLNAKEAVILDLIQRAEGYAQRLEAQTGEFVLCHADLHAGNLLIADHGGLYIVDWDAPILAPKERDLMYIGGAQGFRGVTARQEQVQFYRGYGAAPVDPMALAYYRYERILQDIAAFCEQLLLTDTGGEDRQQSFDYLASNFLPGNTIAVAYHADKQ